MVLQLSRKWRSPRIFTRSLLTTKQTLTSLLSRSYTFAVAPLSTPPPPPSSLSSSLSLLLLRPLVAANFHRLSPSTTTVRGYFARRTSSSPNDRNRNVSDQLLKETTPELHWDFEHWLVAMEKPEGDPTRDEIIDSYIKTLAQVVGSEDEARMKIYSVSTRHYFAFGALVSEELANKLQDLPNVRFVGPDSYSDDGSENEGYGGEPFIDGQAVPYDPKYHEEWLRNNASGGTLYLRAFTNSS